MHLNASSYYPSFFTTHTAIVLFVSSCPNSTMFFTSLLYKGHIQNEFRKQFRTVELRRSNRVVYYTDECTIKKLQVEKKSSRFPMILPLLTIIIYCIQTVSHYSYEPSNLIFQFRIHLPYLLFTQASLSL